MKCEDSEMSSEIDRTCRICLKVDQPTFKIETEVLEIFTYCTNLEVIENDGLPKNICLCCFKKLKVANEIKHAAEESDRYLRNLLYPAQDLFTMTEIKQENEYGFTIILTYPYLNDIILPEKIS